MDPNTTVDVIRRAGSTHSEFGTDPNTLISHPNRPPDQRPNDLNIVEEPRVPAPAPGTQAPSPGTPALSPELDNRYRQHAQHAQQASATQGAAPVGKKKEKEKKHFFKEIYRKYFDPDFEEFWR